MIQCLPPLQNRPEIKNISTLVKRGRKQVAISTHSYIDRATHSICGYLQPSTILVVRGRWWNITLADIENKPVKVNLASSASAYCAYVTKFKDKFHTHLALPGPNSHNPIARHYVGTVFAKYDSNAWNFAEEWRKISVPTTGHVFRMCALLTQALPSWSFRDVKIRTP